MVYVINYNFYHVICNLPTLYLEVSYVGEEEADEGQSQRPFGDGADDVRCETLEKTKQSN